MLRIRGRGQPPALPGGYEWLDERNVENGSEPPAKPRAVVSDPRMRLRENLIHDFAGYVGEPEVAALVAVGEPLVVDA
jgi:hypothetical protein